MALSYLVPLLIVAAISFASGALPLYTKLREVPLSYWISFASGTLLATAFFRMIPKSFELSNLTSFNTALILASGFFIFYLIENFVIAKGHDEHYHGDSFEGEHVHHTGILGVLALATDNLLDGAAIAATWLTDPSLGLIVSIAVIAHEIPHSLATVTLLRKDEMAKNKILGILLMTVLLIIVGGVFAGTTGIAKLPQIIAFTAGAFLYFGASHLLPESHEDVDWKVIASFVIGVLVIYLGTVFIG